jgi:CPA2 family monovalent cation:H+ antiporter-2
MEDIGLIIDLVMTLGIALIGGLVARRLGMPVLVGYILAGIVIGPQTPGLVADGERVKLMANLGVAFLMFALGVEFSLAQLLSVRRTAVITGAIQMPATVLLGTGVGVALGWETRSAVLLGLAFLACSSIVVIKLTLSRGEATSPHARAALGLGILQDLSLVPLLALLPILKSDTTEIFLPLVKSLLMAAAALVVVIVVGTWLVPKVFNFIARSGTRELFLLTIMVIALGTAYASHEAGLSYALGAFLAGLVVSESEFDTHVLAEIIPLRDVFSTLFFVSLGMLLDPHLFLDHPLMIAVIVVVLVIGKFLASLAGYLVSGVGPVVATKAALLTAQIGEFSFVLASIGLSDAIIDDEQYSLILGIALASILLSPLLLMADPFISPVIQRLPFLRDHMLASVDREASYGEMQGHVIICGYGRVGEALAETLIRRQLQFVVIDMNPAVVQDLQSRGIPALYGDSTAEPVLRRAGVEHARIIAVTVPNTIVALRTSRIAKGLNPDLEIVVRAGRAMEMQGLRVAGASDVVQPEFEAGLEFMQHVLRHQGVSAMETQEIVDRRRHRFYQDETPELAFHEDA